MSDEAFATLRRGGRGRVRDRLRRARLYRARGRLGASASATASRSTSRPRRPTWTATRWRSSCGCGPRQVRIVPTACGGGFGGKLDLSVQPLVAVAAWMLRPAGRAASTRGRRAWRPRPSAIPARIARQVRLRCRRAGSLACEVHGDFDTGAYASLGPDRRQPRAGACHRALRACRTCAARGRGLLHQRPAVRRLPRLRRAAGAPSRTRR